LTEVIVTVTKKGQATIPSKMRKRHKIGRKVLAVDTEAGILFKPVADPLQESGSLKELFGGSNSRQLIEAARSVEYQKERTPKRR
jgi:bifunctional DNA-binding transcriptional regulator/antitoxin component of YhaV-PrlF toxin-antitoxin module